MSAFFLAVRLLYARLNPAAVRAGALLLAFALLASGGVLGYRAWQRQRLATAQAAATARHAADHAAAVAAYTAYRLDSTRRATERAALLHDLTTQHAENEALRRRRPALIELPALPPRDY